MSSTQRTVVLVQPHCSFRLRGPAVLHTQFDSLGLLALSAWLRAHGARVQIIHFARALAQGESPESLFQRILDLDPVLVGVSINWLHLSQGALEIAEALKRRSPALPIVAGGQHASLFADEIAARHRQCFEGVVVGEGEETLLELVERAGRGEPLAGTPGFAAWRDGAVVHEPRRITLELDQLPLVTYQDVYPAPEADGPAKHLAALDTTRGGCLKDCNYCLESRSMGCLGRARPAQYSADRLAAQVASFAREGRTWITIQDQFCTFGSRPLIEFIDRLAAGGVWLDHLSLFLEPGCYDEAAFDALARAPAREVVVSYGIETGSPKVARNLRRFHDYGAIREELEAVSRRPFGSSTWWMLGLPEESDEDVRLTREMILETMRLGIHPKWVTPLILFPQTALAREAERFKIRPIFRTFEDFTRFSLVPRNEYGTYPELITHESAYQPAHDTLRHVTELKKAIEAQYSIVEAAAGGKTNFTAFASFNRGSFF